MQRNWNTLPSAILLSRLCIIHFPNIYYNVSNCNAELTLAPTATRRILGHELQLLLLYLS